MQHGQFPAHHLIVHGERRGLRFECSDTLAWRRSYVCPGVAWDGDHPSVRRCRFFLRLDGAPAYAAPHGRGRAGPDPRRFLAYVTAVFAQWRREPVDLDDFADAVHTGLPPADGGAGRT